MFKLSGVIVIMAVFSACFSPWAGDPGVVTITFGDGGQEAARSAVTREEIPTLTHIITLYGNGTPVTARLVGAGTVSITVLQGNWNIRVRAESPEPEQTLRALGFGQVRVVAGRSTSAVVYMVSATEVANHAQLAAAISGARTDGLEKIIVLTEDMCASAQFTVGTNRHISLVSDSDVAIRRGAGFNPEVDMFVMQGNATLRLGRQGINGNITVYGQTGAVLPPLEEDPPAPAEELEIDENNVLRGRGTVPPTVTDIVIPHGVTRIATDAFRSGNLTSVIIPDTVEAISGGAFRYNSLTSVIIPNNVTSIGNSAFSGNGLTSVTIGTRVTHIGTWAFGNNSLTHVTIPNSVNIIGNQAFANNYLESVTIPASVTNIGGWAFDNNELRSVTIVSSTTGIGDSAFRRNNNLESVTIPFASLPEADTFLEGGGTLWRSGIPTDTFVFRP
jgi:hypothetical protein